MKAEDLELGRVWYPPPPGEKCWRPAQQWTRDEWAWWCAHGLRRMGPEAFAQYWEDRYRWGFGIRLTDRHGRPTGDIKWLYNPLPAAVAFHAAWQLYVLFGGARGGSKSHSLRWDIHRRCATVEGYRAILFRRLFVELELYHIDRAAMELPEMTNGVGKVVAGTAVYGNRAQATFGHCKDPGDEAKYLGSEWDYVGFDQWETFFASQSVDIMGSARTTKPGVRSMVRGTANPGGVDPQWIVDRFITKDPPPDEALGYDPSEWLYIPAYVYDNAFLMDADGSFRRYEGRLLMYGEVRRRQMLLGDWAAREGQFYPELDERVHVAVRTVPEGTRWYGGLDYGYNRPGCFVAVAALPDGRLYVRHDFKFRGRALFAAPREQGESQSNYQARSKETVANQIVALCAREHIKLTTLFVDPDLDAQKSGVETGIQGLRRAGLPAVPAENARYLGSLRLRHWFAKAPDGAPWLQFHPDAKYVWRSCATLTSDDKEPDLPATDGDDHGFDSLRYLVQGRPSPDSRQQGRTKFTRGSIGDMIRREQGKRGMAQRVL